MGLYLDHTFESCRVVPEARLRPVFRLLRQAAPDRIPVYIPQFLYTLFFAPHVEVIITTLPVLNLFTCFQLAGRLLLQHLQRNRQRGSAWLANKQVDMLGHHNIAGDHKAVSLTHGLKLLLEDAARPCRAQQRLTAITTERHKMKTAALLVTDKLRLTENSTPDLMLRVLGLSTVVRDQIKTAG